MIRITCIKKDGGNHENPFVAISELRWENTESHTSGRSTRLAMWDYVSAPGNSAWVVRNGTRVRVIPAVSARGTKYVITEANHTEDDNLLKLPECR